MDITPRHEEVTYSVTAQSSTPGVPDVYLEKSLVLSLPSNDDFKYSLTSFSTRLANRYLVRRMIQRPPDPDRPGSNITTPLYSIAKPFVWYRNESVGSVSEERSGDKLRGNEKRPLASEG